MARRAEAIGVVKSASPTLPMFTLAVLAGAFIALGAMFATTTSAGLAGAVPYGLARLAVGFVFTLGLALVVVGGAELFTGNNLIIMAWVSRKVTTRQIIRNWIVVYAGNFVGAIGTALLVFVSGQYQFGNGTVGASALIIGESKLGYGFVQAVALGILCNALVCLAIWLTYSGRTLIDRIVALVPPITAFVAAGFEHSIANMYFIPFALLIKYAAPDSYWTTIGTTAAAYPRLAIDSFLLGNLLPVTIGNIIGGSGLVGLVYWLAYLRPSPIQPGAPTIIAAEATPDGPAPRPESARR
ncbi:MAG: formate transporter FocA [Chloroflexota bacterium]|nr:MAG: formate transporter FocA [Chloroflexota bacterium]